MAMLGLLASAMLLLGFSESAVQAAARAAALFASSVLPALFPLAVLAALPQRDAKVRFVQTSALLFGWLAGSPASARRIRTLWEEGVLTPADAERLFWLAGVMSPMFFLGTLSLWLRSARAGWLLWGSHLLSAALTGALLRLLPQKSAPAIISPPSAPPQGLSGALSAAAQAMLSVCGAMMLFAVAGELLRRLLSLLCPQAALGSGFAVFLALLEIASGASALIQGGHASLPLLCALCSFGGLSLWVQNLALGGNATRPLRLLCGRALHGALAYGVCAALQSVFQVALPATAGGAFIPPASSPALPLLLWALWLLPTWAQKSKTCWRHS